MKFRLDICIKCTLNIFMEFMWAIYTKNIWHILWRVYMAYLTLGVYIEYIMSSLCGIFYEEFIWHILWRVYMPCFMRSLYGIYYEKFLWNTSWGVYVTYFMESLFTIFYEEFIWNISWGVYMVYFMTLYVEFSMASQLNVCNIWWHVSCIYMVIVWYLRLYFVPNHKLVETEQVNEWLTWLSCWKVNVIKYTI